MPNVNIIVDINESIYLKDPQSTSLGRSIIKHAILLIDEIGFERLNFKKLAESIESSEASLYRYFENKYKLLTYLVSWYWDFMHFMMLMDLRYISDPKEKLKVIIKTLVNSLNFASTPDYIDVLKLHNVIVENASKVYHTKKVDKLVAEGYYQNIGKLVTTIADIISEINSNYKYPRALAINIIDQSLNNEYYLDHLPWLIEGNSDRQDSKAKTVDMIQYMLDRTLNLQ